MAVRGEDTAGDGPGERRLGHHRYAPGPSHAFHLPLCIVGGVDIAGAVGPETHHGVALLHVGAGHPSPAQPPSANPTVPPRRTSTQSPPVFGTANAIHPPV